MMIATGLTVGAAVYLFASILILAPRKAGYSHVTHTISELGEVGAPNQQFVAYGLFLPIGLLLLVVAALIHPRSVPTFALALCIAVGYVTAAAFPCDPGAPLAGSARQAAHTLGGAVQYVGGSLAFMAIAEDYGEPFQAVGILVLGLSLALSILPSTVLRGIIQRVAEACLFGGLALAAWQATSTV